MKAVFTLVLIIIFGLLAIVNKSQSYDTMESSKVGVILDTRANNYRHGENYKEFSFKEKVARLYKFKNDRIKKALSFEPSIIKIT